MHDVESVCFTINEYDQEKLFSRVLYRFFPMRDDYARFYYWRRKKLYSIRNCPAFPGNVMLGIPHPLTPRASSAVPSGKERSPTDVCEDTPIPQNSSSSPEVSQVVKKWVPRMSCEGVPILRDSLSPELWLVVKIPPKGCWWGSSHVSLVTEWLQSSC